MMVAVGFNPRFASPHLAVRRVATGRKLASYTTFIQFDLMQPELGQSDMRSVARIILQA